MTVESASYISQLDTTLPTAADLISEGDDHLRLVKTALKTQFPNFGTTAISASAAEVNYSVGVTSAIQTQLNSKAPTASPTFTGTAVLPATTSIGTVSDVEIATLDGVTSSIQTQINGKGAITGQAWTGAHSFAGATSVPTLAAGSNTTGAASTAFVQADFLQKFPNYTAPVAASTAELNHLVGVTSAIQPQLSNQVSGPIHAATSKTTPVDADELGITDSAASWGLKKLTFANLKAWISSLGGAGISNTPSGNISATNVQAAINELAEIKVDLAAASGSSLVGFQQDGTGAVVRTMNDKAKEIVSVKDFGAVGDGVADDTTPIQKAINSLSVSGGCVLIPKGTYKITAPLTLVKGVTLKGEGKRNTVLTAGALTFILQALGSLSVTPHTLSANAEKGSRTISLTAGGSAYQVGDYALLQAENLPFAGALATQKQAEFVRVESVATDTITVRGGLAFSYTTANTAKLTKLDPVRNFAVEDLGVTSADPATFARIFCDFEYCADFAIRRCHFYNGKSAAIYLLGCVNAEVDSCTGRDLQSDPVVAGAYGYFVCEAGPNLNLHMHGCSTESVRHTYTTVVGGGTATVQDYGFPLFSKVSDCKSLWPFAAGFDTHPGAGFGIEFDNCSVFKGNQFGFQVRSEDTIVKSCFSYGSVAPAVYVTNYGNNSYILDVHSEDACTGTDSSGNNWTTWGAFADNSQNTIWKNTLAKNSGGPAFEQVRGGGGCEVIGLRAMNPCRIDTSVKSGIVVTGTSAGSVLIDNPTITCSDTRMDYGILSASESPQLLVSGDYITGSQVARYSVAHATSYFLNSKRSSAINTYGRGEAITIAAGVLSVANLGSGYLVVNGEGGLADDLVTINGGTDGDMIVLRKSSPTITVKHGTGNIQLTDNVDHALINSFSILTLIRIGTVWVEVARRT